MTGFKDISKVGRGVMVRLTLAGLVFVLGMCLLTVGLGLVQGSFGLQWTWVIGFMAIGGFMAGLMRFG